MHESQDVVFRKEAAIKNQEGPVHPENRKLPEGIQDRDDIRYVSELP